MQRKYYYEQDLARLGFRSAEHGVQVAEEEEGGEGEAEGYEDEVEDYYTRVSQVQLASATDKQGE